MNFLDLLFLIPIGWLTYKGYTKGLIMGIFSLAAIFVGVYACIHFTDFTSSFLQKHFPESWATWAVWVYLLTFCGAFIGVYFLGKLLEKFFQAGGLGTLNKLGGAFLGTVKAVLLISGLLAALNAFNTKEAFISVETQNESLLYKPVSKFSYWLIPAFHKAGWLSDHLNELKQSIPRIDESNSADE